MVFNFIFSNLRRPSVHDPKNKILLYNTTFADRAQKLNLEISIEYPAKCLEKYNNIVEENPRKALGFHTLRSVRTSVLGVLDR